MRRLHALLCVFLVWASCLLPALADGPPGEVGALRFTAGGETLLWDAAEDAVVHDVHRGSDPALGDHSCIAGGLSVLSLATPDTPSGGSGLHYYLVAGLNDRGLGSFGAGRSRGVDPDCDSDGDGQPDALDNCALQFNVLQADQNLDGLGDLCDPKTYSFEKDTSGLRPLETTQLGGTNASFVVVDAAGDLAASYGGSVGGVSDRLDRLEAPMPFQDTTLWLDVAAPLAPLSVELWSDGALPWLAGTGLIFQLHANGQSYFYERDGNSVPVVAGSMLPTDHDPLRLRLRLDKGVRNESILHVDVRDVDGVPGWTEDYTAFIVREDTRYRGRHVALADYFGGQAVVTRLTVEHAIPAAALSVRKDPEWSDDWKLFQRDENELASIPVRCSYRSENPARLEARLVDSSSGLALPGLDWGVQAVDLPAAGQGAGAELEFRDAPTGGNYDLELRLVRMSDGELLGSAVLVELAVGDVWLCGGQSNMAGYSGPYVVAEEPVDEVHLFHNDGTWKRAAEPMDDGLLQVDHISAESPGHSLMLAFAKELQAVTGVPIGIIPGPLGGTNLFAQWQRDEARHDNRGTLYGSLLHRAALQHGAVPPKGFLWFQGESDALSARSRDQYQADLELLVARYREDLSNPELFFVNAQLGTFTNTDLGLWMPIQEAQRRQASADPLSALVTTIDQPRADAIHFNADGYRTIGRRFANAALELAYAWPVDSSTRLIGARLSAPDEITLRHDAPLDESSGAASLFAVVDGMGAAAPVLSLTVVGDELRLNLERSVSGTPLVSYGFSTDPSSAWVKDANGVPTACFLDVPVGP